MSETRNERRRLERQGKKMLQQMKGKDLRKIYNGKEKAIIIQRAPWYRRALAWCKNKLGKGPQITKA